MTRAFASDTARKNPETHTRGSVLQLLLYTAPGWVELTRGVWLLRLATNYSWSALSMHASHKKERRGRIYLPRECTISRYGGFSYYV